MRQLLIASMAPVLWILTVLNEFFICRMFVQYRRKKNVISLIVAVMCMGLLYDSLCLALGAFLKESAALRFFSQFRYIFHLTMIPLIFPICAYSLKAKAGVRKAVWCIAVIIMVIGLAAGILIKTEPRTVGAITRYAEAEGNPGWIDGIVSFLDMFPVFLMIGVGIFLFRKKNPNMFLAGFFMLLFTLLGIFLGKDPSGDRAKSLMFYISMFGEGLMVYFLWRFTEKEEDREETAEQN